MKKLLAFLFIGVVTLSVYNPASAAVITFDDITTNKASTIPSDYAGFSWGIAGSSDEIRAVQDTLYGNTYTYPFSTEDINYAAFNYTGNMKTISFNELIDFNGAYFSGFGYENEIGTWDVFASHEGDTTPWTATQVTVTGYNGGAIVGSVTLYLNPSDYQWLEADFGGLIDSLVIESSIYIDDQKIEVASSFWLMDNFTFNENMNNDAENPAPVPEPGTMLLLGTGIIGLAGFKRKYRKS